MLQLMTSSLGGEVREVDVEVAAELPEDLAARAARRRRRFRVGDDGDAREDVMAFRQRLEHRDALGANRQTVGRVLDVAAGEDRAIAGLERRADLESRERRIGVVTSAPGRRDDVDLARLAAEAPRTDPAVSAVTPVAFGPADVARAALEPRAPIGLDGRRAP